MRKLLLVSTLVFASFAPGAPAGAQGCVPPYCPAPAPAPAPTAPPSATTGSASDVTDSSATLSGSINPNGSATTYHFNYGVGAFTSSTAEQSAGSGTSTVPSFLTGINGLQPDSQYLFQLVATNKNGTTVGATQSFVTARPTGASFTENSTGDGASGADATVASATRACINNPQVITGTNTDDRIQGTSLADAIFGLGGKDLLDSGLGNDCVDAGDGTDRVNLGAGNDVATGGPGADLMNGASGSDLMHGDDGHPCGPPPPPATTRATCGSFLARASAVVSSSGADEIDGGTGRDKLYGDAGNDKISGGGGNDQISGGSGNDQISGGSGNDTITGSPGRDSINAGDGDDQLHSFDRQTDNVSCGPGRDRILADRRDKLQGCERVAYGR